MLARTLIARPNIEKIIRSADLDVAATTQIEKDKLVDSVSQRIKFRGGRAREHLQHLLPGRESGPCQACRPGPAVALRGVGRRQQAARLRSSPALHRRADQDLREEARGGREPGQGLQDQEPRLHQQRRAGLLHAHERRCQTKCQKLRLELRAAEAVARRAQARTGRRGSGASARHGIGGRRPARRRVRRAHRRPEEAARRTDASLHRPASGRASRRSG